jgi:hypothetical protein
LITKACLKDQKAQSGQDLKNDYPFNKKNYPGKKIVKNE